MKVDLESSGLIIGQPSGPLYFNYFWLRDNCSSSFDPETRERSFDIATLAEPPQAISADLSDTELRVSWRGECKQSVYDLAWLQRFAEPAARPDPAAIPRKLWLADHYNDMQRFSFTDLLADRVTVCAWAHALLEDGISIVDGMPDTDQGLTDLASRLGCIRSSVAGNYFDVRVHIDPVNLSYTASALELHTDTPAEDLPPGIQFLHCRANSVKGGDSLFLDGAAVAEDFRKTDPNGFALLAETKIPFYYDHDAFDWRARQRVIELDTTGAVSGVTVSRHMADVLDLPQKDLDAYYPALWRFSRAMADPAYIMKFRLNAGECIVFDNHRIVHGREAYTANSGERYLRGCYIDRGELRSTYRTLVKQSTENG